MRKLCQDISIAGKGEGIEGSRSGLWFAMLKSIRILRPRFVIAENVGAITFRGLDTVLGTLAEIGYNAEWQDIRASDMGAPHKRERIWIVAYPRCGPEGREKKSQRTYDKSDRCGSVQHGEKHNRIGKGKISNPDRIDGDNAGHGTSEICRERSEQAEIQRCKDVANTESGRSGKQKTGNGGKGIEGRSIKIPNTTEQRLQGEESTRGDRGKQGLFTERCGWEFEPDVGRLAHGVSRRVDRLKGLGNSIVPQIAELLFGQIKRLL